MMAWGMDRLLEPAEGRLNTTVGYPWRLRLLYRCDGEGFSVEGTNAYAVRQAGLRSARLRDSWWLSRTYVSNQGQS